MTGDDAEDDGDGDRERVPAALRERVESLFVQYRGYEPATFQEALSLATDLAEAQVEAAGQAAADAGADADPSVSPGHDDAFTDASAGPTSGDEQVTDLSAEVVDDASEQSFSELDDPATADASPADATPGDLDAEAAGDASAGSADEEADDGDEAFQASLRADPESNCAVCGDVHPVSVLRTTIPDDADSVALVCPDCAD